MLFHKKLYFDEKLSKSKRKVLKKLKQGNLQLGIHVITVSLSKEDMLEIYPAYVLLQRIYRELPLVVVGVASDREAASELLIRITADCLLETGDVDLRQYFSDR